ncbi:MAG: FliH/SctL family protein [Nocardioidaceae bacterium]
MSSERPGRIELPDLRSGHWTRLGDARVLGDSATEAAVAGLAARVRAAARAQGYAAGWAEGTSRATVAVAAADEERAALAEQERLRVAGDQRSALTALTHALDECDAATRVTYDDIAGRAVELGLRIAEAVLGRELAVATDPGADALHRALTGLGPQAAVTVRMHPDDRARLDAGVLEGREATFVDDTALQRGDAVVETETQVVDATVAAALERVRQVLA